MWEINDKNVINQNILPPLINYNSYTRKSAYKRRNVNLLLVVSIDVFLYHVPTRHRLGLRLRFVTPTDDRNHNFESRLRHSFNYYSSYIFKIIQMLNYFITTSSVLLANKPQWFKTVLIMIFTSEIFVWTQSLGSRRVARCSR